MRSRRFGRIGRDVPLVGQGTWQMEEDGRAAAAEALLRGLDAGMCHVDTAEMYGNGGVEELVGEVLGARRGELFLVSKVLPQNASRKGTIQACERSLRRLRTDTLDLYLLHWPGKHPLEETISAFEALRAAGKIAAWGVSNFDVSDLEEAISIAGAERIACNQVLYHLGERGIEHGVLPFCEANGIPVVAYSPFGSGRFPGPRSAGGRVLEEIGAAHGASARQIALAYLVQHPNVWAIPKAGRADHALDNAAAADVELRADQVERIDLAFPRGPRPRELPTI
jgi:diketogulonate reductase-like aldo/keto reductase